MDQQTVPPEFNNAAQPDAFEKMKQYREQQAEVPVETDDTARLKKWSWGAFGFGWIWGVGNNTYIMLLSMIPLVSIVMAFVGGVKGNRWAYENGDWHSVDEYMRAQRSWETAGMVQFFMVLAFLGLYIVLIILIAIAAGQLGFFN